MQAFSMTIDGRAESGSGSFEVINPADLSVVAHCPEGSPALIDAAVKAARRAFPAWSGLPDAERADTLRRLADLIDSHHDELSQLVTREQGKPQSGPGANFELSGAALWTRTTASLTLPPAIIQDDAHGRVIATRKPVGVVGSITPWNWPLIIAVWHAMPALRVGCTVVIKPSPFTPLSTLRLVEILNGVLPPGVLNAVTGGGDVGAHLAAHPGVDKLVFTGGVATGQRIMESAAPTLKRLTLELGGNDAGIVLPGTDLGPLLEKLFWGCFINAGQTCAALKRLYVHADQYDECVRQFAEYLAKVPVGDGLDPQNLVGPVSNKLQYEKVRALVEDARGKGARILEGASVPATGLFHPLTLVADATDDMRVVAEEQFGPVVPILKYRNLEEAIARANSAEVGLGGSIWGNDPEEAARHAARLECGTAWVNQHGALHPLAPFGGIKHSGMGVQFGPEGLQEFTTTQVLNIGF
jgi:acyl-CoA reductase-like NAD-dependent aldehyde dehydrogenase